LITAALGTGLLLLGACGWETSPNAFTDDSGVDARITSVRVDNDSGDVKIRTGDRATVHRSVHYDDVRPNASHHVEGDVLVIDRCPVRNCWIGYEVTVPTGTRVDGSVDSGRVEVDGVAGVNLEADSGDLIARGVSGTVNVVSHSGDVTVDNARAAVTVQADSGAIRMSVPAGTYQVHASTDSGAVRSDVADDPSGTHRLELHSDSGDITVRYR
jgi:hypothetical protein